MRSVVEGRSQPSSTLLNLASIRDCPEISPERCWSSTRIDVRSSSGFMWVFRAGEDDSGSGCSRGGWCQRHRAVSKTDHRPRDSVTRRTHHISSDVRIYIAHRAAYQGNAPELTPKNIEYFVFLKLQNHFDRFSMVL